MVTRATILVVDNTPENLRILGNLLEEEYDVRVATNGHQALDSVQAAAPDLILLDVMMPGMGGNEVCRRLKANPDLRMIPVIFISALDAAEQKVQAFREGAVDYITKPFQAEEVVARVRTHLQLSKLEELKREIAERKRAEAEREELQAQLRQAQKMEAIGTLAGGIAHDFNNILGAILGNAELLHMSLEDGGVPDWLSLQEIQRAAKRASDLVRQILTFSRRSDTRKTSVRLQPIVEETLSFLRGALPANIELRQETTGQGSTILADATHIHQIVMNLCTNAAHAMRERGGILTVGLRSVELDNQQLATFGQLAAGSYLELRVSDTGSGIAPEHIHRIFEPFFTTKAQGEGTGLGLAVVHGIVRDHAGAISVDSTVGRGTVVRVLLPQTRDVESLSLPAVRPSALPNGREKILLVDDEESLLLVLSKMLRLLGYQVVTRSHIAGAYELVVVERQPFDLILTDLMMPQGTGLELRQKLTDAGVDIPMLLATGYGDSVTGTSASELGFAEVLEKPLGMTDLALSVRRVLDQRSKPVK